MGTTFTKANAYSTPYSVAAFWKSSQRGSGATITGLYLYDGTKLLGLEFLSPSSADQTLRIEHITKCKSHRWLYAFLLWT